MAASLPSATPDQRLYDLRYGTGYMQGFTHLYEATRELTVRAVLSRLATDGLTVRRILDYGAGSGRWFPHLKKFFPGAEVTGADISEVALEQGRELHPEMRCVHMSSERVDLPDGGFDLVVSIEVLEHVQDVALAMAEIGRLMTPGAVAVLSTPCANRWSLEWAINRLRGGLQPSADGYGRFATDEPGHLRRLREADLRALTHEVGLRMERVYHSAHLFTTLAVAPERIRGYQRIPLRLRVAFAMLDWHLMRNAPNGASMIAVCARGPS